MKIHFLDYILVTAHSPSITAAAEQLFLCQTTLSAAIKSVEQELNITIFERNRQGIRLTEDGRKFIALADEIMQRYREMQELSSDHVRPMNRSFTLLAHPIASARYSCPLVQAYQRSAHYASLSIVECPGDQMLEQLTQGKARIGIGQALTSELGDYMKRYQDAGLTVEPLATERSYLYVSSSSRLTGRTEVSLPELQGEYLAMTPHGFQVYQRDELYRYLPHYSIFSNDHLVRQAIIEGNMIAFHTSGSPGDDWFNTDGKLCRLNVVGRNNSSMCHCLVYAAGMAYSVLTHKLLDCIRETLSAPGGRGCPSNV